MDEQKKQQGEPRLVWTGLIGSVIVALCCFTPLFVVLLGSLGVGALTGYLDYVLLPALAIFAGITLYGVFRQQRMSKRPCCAEPPNERIPFRRMR